MRNYVFGSRVEFPEEYFLFSILVFHRKKIATLNVSRLIVASVRFSNIFRCQNIAILCFSDLNGSKLTFFLALIFILSSIFDHTVINI